MKFKESETAHRYLDGLKGLEIGGSAHNAFGLNTLNVDYTDSLDTPFKESEIELCGKAMKVDIVANGDDIPVEDNSFDFVISSHVIEHFYSPIDAILEWKRVIKTGGIIFIIAPNRNALESDRGKPITNLYELIDRHKSMFTKSGHDHFTIFDVKLLVNICIYSGLEVIETQATDDKVGNGMTVICKKI